MSYRVKGCLIAILVLACLPPPLQAAPYQIAPNPNPSGSTITISESDAENRVSFTNESGGILDIVRAVQTMTGGTLTNYAGAVLNNNGTLTTGPFPFAGYGYSDTSGGRLVNYGTINNNVGGFIRNYYIHNYYGGEVNNYGVLYNYLGGSISNYATLNNNASGTVNNEGVITTINNSTINNYGNVNNFYVVHNGGNFNNFNTLHIRTDNYQHSGQRLNCGAFYNNSGGILNNDGSLFNASKFTNGQNATLNNNVGHSFINYEGAILTNAGSLNNYGTLENNMWYYIQGPTAELKNTDGGVLNNFGTLNNRGLFNNESGATFNNSGNFDNRNRAEFNNRGTINNSGMFIVEANTDVYNILGGTFNNVNTVTINTSGLLANGSGSTINNMSNGTFTNNGTIDTSDGIINNWGLLNNIGRITSGWYGGAGAPLNNYGELNNWGTVENSQQINNFGIFNNNAAATLLHFGTPINSFQNSGTLKNDGVVSGGGAFVQTAGITINNGSFRLPTINIQGGILSGTGTMELTGSTPLTMGAGATLSPGNSIGTFTLNGNLSSDGDFLFEIGGAGVSDVLDINGNAAFTGGTMQFDFIGGYSPSAGDNWDFLIADLISGWDLLAFDVNGLGAGLDWQIVTGGTYGKLLITADSSAPVPEPSTMLLLGSGLVGLVGYRRRRFQK